MADMNMNMEIGNIKNGYIVDGIIKKGLNLLVVPSEEEVFCITFSIALCVANGIEFLDRKTRQCRVLYFALGDNSRERTRQQIADIAGSDETLKNVTVIYAYESGSFGDRMEDGMEVFLYDNPQTKMIVIDSLEQVVESETGQMKCDYAYSKLCALKKVANRHGVALLVVTHITEENRLAEAANVILHINRGENQNKSE